jgi:hypothetical protein
MRLCSLGARPIEAAEESPRGRQFGAAVFGPLSLPSLSPTLLSLLVCWLWWWRDPPRYRPHADAAQNFPGLAERSILKILLRGEVLARCPKEPVRKILLLVEEPVRCVYAAAAARGSAATTTATTATPALLEWKRCGRYA